MKNPKPSPRNKQKVSKKSKAFQQAKKSRLRLYFAPWRRANRSARAVGFAVVFAVFGAIVFLLLTRAASPLPGAVNEVVLEYGHSGPLQVVLNPDGSYQTNELIGFRLMGDGSLYCGNQPDTTNTATVRTLRYGQLKNRIISQLYNDSLADSNNQLPRTVGVDSQPVHLGSYDYLFIGSKSQAQASFVYDNAQPPQVFTQIVNRLSAQCDKATTNVELKDVPVPKPLKLGIDNHNLSIWQRLARISIPQVTAQYSPVSDTEAENDQFSRITNDRQQAQTTPVVRSDCLSAAARDWANTMAQEAYFAHSSSRYDFGSRITNYCGSGWQSLAENVGFTTYSGNSVNDSARTFGSYNDSIYDDSGFSFLSSCGHRANIESFQGTYVNGNAHQCSSITAPGTPPNATHAGTAAYRSSGCPSFNASGQQSGSTTGSCMYVVQLFASCPSCGGKWNNASTSPPPATSTPTPSPTPTPTPTPAPSVPTAQRYVGVGSNRCLDVTNGSVASGTATQLWDCHGGPNQQWTLKSDKTLRSAASGKCLDVNNGSTASGTPVIIWDCHGGPNQQWNMNSDQTIRSAASGKCLDAYNGGTGDGTKVIIWDCHGGPNQRWHN